MTTKALTVSIPNPCSENWNNMTPQEKGRFCDACQKCVVDFTALSDAAVLDYFNKNNGKICGRFHKRQLDRMLIINDKRFQKRFNIAASLLFLSSLGFANSVKNEAVLPFKISSFYTQKKEVNKPVSKDSISNDKITINGNIFAAENPKEPLAEVHVLLKGTAMSRVSGNEGDFSFTIPKEALKDGVLVFTFIGYETQELSLSKLVTTKNLVVTLKESQGLLGDIVVTHRRPNLWKRFTNLFRSRENKKY